MSKLINPKNLHTLKPGTILRWTVDGHFAGAFQHTGDDQWVNRATRQTYTTRELQAHLEQYKGKCYTQ